MSLLVLLPSELRLILGWDSSLSPVEPPGQLWSCLHTAMGTSLGP